MASTRATRTAWLVGLLASPALAGSSASANAPPPAVAAPPCSDFAPSHARAPAFGAASTPATAAAAAGGDLPGADGGVICEGFVEQTVSEPFLELVSLTRGVPRLDDDLPVRLVQAAVPMARVVLQPRSGTPLYRVETTLPAGRPVPWNPAAMLRATGLQPRDIASLARAPDDGTRRLRAAPLRLETGGPAGAPRPATVYAVIRTSVDIASLSWRQYDDGQAADAPFHDAADSALFAWQTYALALPGAPAGRARVVEVTARSAGGQPLPMLVITVLGDTP